VVVTDLTIRKIKDADLQTVGVVGFAAWAASDPYEDSYRDSDIIERVRQEFATFANTTAAEIVVAELNGEIVGWGARENAPNYISDLWVHPAHQGKGIGKALLLHLCELMKSEGLDTARLDTHAKNNGAIRLYKRCGFAIIWHGIEFSKSMGVPLEKVHLQKQLAQD
jgi:ribosomal-protein-alanine N-acetyltransferase